MSCMKQIAQISGLNICRHGIAMLQSLERHFNFTVALSTHIVQAQVVRKVDNAIYRINHCPADSMVCFISTRPLDSDLSSG